MNFYINISRLNSQEYLKSKQKGLYVFICMYCVIDARNKTEHCRAYVQTGRRLFCILFSATSACSNSHTVRPTQTVNAASKQASIYCACPCKIFRQLPREEELRLGSNSWPPDEKMERK